VVVAEDAEPTTKARGARTHPVLSGRKGGKAARQHAGRYGLGKKLGKTETNSSGGLKAMGRVRSTGLISATRKNGGGWKVQGTKLGGKREDRKRDKIFYRLQRGRRVGLGSDRNILSS